MAAFFNSFFLNFYRNGVQPITYHHKRLIIKDGIFSTPSFYLFHAIKFYLLLFS